MCTWEADWLIYTCGIRKSFSRLATWMDVTLDGAATTPAIISGSSSLHSALVPAILLTEPGMKEIIKTSNPSHLRRQHSTAVSQSGYFPPHDSQCGRSSFALTLGLSQQVQIEYYYVRHVDTLL